MAVYKPDRHGIHRMLQSRELMEAPLLAITKAMEAEATATAPRSEGDSGGVHFQDSFHSKVMEDDILSRYGGPRRGLVGYMYSTDPVALEIETGTSRTPAHNTMTRAMGVVGRG